MLYNPTFSAIATPTQLTTYADVLVHAGLGHGKGIDEGDIVLIQFSPESSILVPYIQASVTKAGGHLLQEPLIPNSPEENTTLALASHGTTEQINFFPLDAKESLYGLAHHFIKIKSPAYSEPDVHFSNESYAKRSSVERQIDDLEKNHKENHWKSYTLAYIPSPALAEQSQVSLETLWNEIVNACHLDSDTAVTNMRDTIARVSSMEEALNALKIRSLHITGEAVDLHLELTPEARFRCSRGGNVPSFECFVTPHAEKTNGWITFTYPLLYEGNRIEGLHVKFTDGKVSQYQATKGQDTFAAIMSLPGMNQLGEFAITDKRFSRISEVIPGAPIFLENIGGTMHVAFGRGYTKCFADTDKTPHCNQSVDHRDMVLNGNFTVTATTATDEDVVVFADGVCPLI
jgi:aminopeptidase